MKQKQKKTKLIKEKKKRKGPLSATLKNPVKGVVCYLVDVGFFHSDICRVHTASN